MHMELAKLPVECVIEHSPVAIVLADAQDGDQPILYANPAFERLTGYSSDEAIGRNCRFLQGPNTDPAAVAELRSSIARGEDAQVVLLNYRADGTPFWNDVQITRVQCSDDQTLYVGVQREVTRPEEAPEKADFDIRIRELQHRVKNHLQMIVSLIRLQSRKDDPTGRISFPELAQRIENLQILYEQLNRSGGTGEVIDLGAYVSQIVAAMTHLNSNGAIRMNVEAEACPVSVDLAVQIGLVLSELVTNALQHAFEGIDGGAVSVRLFDCGDGAMCLKVSDDGIGLPAGADWPQGRGMGGQLILGLVKGAKGELLIDRSGPGTSFTVEFRRDT